MSLILDALKKSEAERQRGQAPNLLSSSPNATAHYSAQKKSNFPWIILTAFLLSVMVFGYVFMKSNNVAAPDIANSQATVIVQPSKASKETTTPEPSATLATSAPPATVTTQVAAPAAPPIQTAPTTPLSPFNTQAGAEPIKPAVQNIEPVPETRIAGMAEMPVDQRQQLPALKLSMHVYSSESAKRFAIIDGQRVNEGSVIGAAVVEEIRQDGVVLSMQGQSYLLPRP